MGTNQLLNEIKPNRTNEKKKSKVASEPYNRNRFRNEVYVYIYI